jgi:transcriptional regulator with XRE-family HTH domain
MATLLSPGNVNRNVGLAISVARDARRMTVTQLAASIGLSAERLAAIENGSDEASAVDMHLLAQVPNLDVAAFFVGLDDLDADDAAEDRPRRLAFPDLLNATIGARMRRLREANGLSAAALAVLSGLRAGRIQRIEAGKSEAAASELYAIGQVLGVCVAFFFDGKRDSDEEPPARNGTRFASSTAAA